VGRRSGVLGILWPHLASALGVRLSGDAKCRGRCDIVQEGFCRMLGVDVEALGDEERRRYLFRIAGNLMIDRWRRSPREQS
jgi:DNA-directed RNA polymerase specialized sigma24 family protein